jgi:hypothetical protein
LQRQLLSRVFREESRAVHRNVSQNKPENNLRSIDKSIDQSFNQSFLSGSVKMNCYETATKIRTNLGIEWIGGVGKAPADLAGWEPHGSGGFPQTYELLEVNVGWPRFVWQKAVFWIPLMRYNSKFADNFRGLF